MNRVLYTIAAMCAVLVIAMWLSLGANTGWSKSLAPVRQIDPVTQIEHIEYERRFLPGLDFLFGGLFATAVVFGGTILIGRLQPKHKRSS